MTLPRIRRAMLRYGPPRWTSKHSASELDLAFLRKHIGAIARTRDGIKFPVETTDIIQRFIYLFGVWEPNLTEWIRHRLQPSDTFIDVGAHHGYYATLASRLVGPSGRVVAIEPIPKFYNQLKLVLELNNCNNVRSIQYAVSESHGQVALWLGGPENLGNTSLYQDAVVQAHHRDHQNRFVDVQTAPLIDLLTDEELKATRLLKIDVEGAEASVISSFANSLNRLRPDCEIIIELAPRILSETGRRVEEIVDPLIREGFHVYRIPNDYDPATYPGDIRRPRPPRRWNEPISDQMDLIFSRVDADALA